MRRLFPAFAVRRPITVIMMVVAICVVGFNALYRIPLQMMPSGFEAPFLWGWIPYQQSSTIEAERSVVLPVEAHLATVPGIKTLRSRATREYAGFFIELHGSTDAGEAYNTISDRLERAQLELPDDVMDFQLFRYNPDDEPILWAGVTIPETVGDPHSALTTGLIRDLERLQGVAKVELWGLNPRQVTIDFDRESLEAASVNLSTLMQRLMQDNFQAGSGRVTDFGQQRYIRSLAKWESLEELKATPVAPGVKLEDVARVRFRAEASADIGRVEGVDAVGFGIYKEATANTVEVATAAREIIRGGPGRNWVERPEGGSMDDAASSSGLMETFIFFDQGETIEEAIDNLTNTAIQGGVLAIIVLFFFLRELRMTMLVATSIPLSLLTTVGLVHARGGTMNLLTLLGLMIAVGMVVDNCIVVVETIFRRRELGESPKDAAVNGTAEVSLAILLSTMTTMVVFLPIILMSDDAMFSFFMGELGLPVVFALGASLVVALLFAPLSTLFIKQAEVPEPKWIRLLSARYRRALDWILSHRSDSSMGLGTILLITVLVPMGAVQCSESSDSIMGEATVRFSLPASFTYSEVVDVTDDLEEWVEEHREEWSVDLHRLRFDANRNSGQLSIHLLEELKGPERREIMDAIQENLPSIEGGEISLSRSSGGMGRGNNVHVELKGRDPELLISLTEEVREKLLTLPSVLSVPNPLEEGGTPELLITVDREALDRHQIPASWVGPTIGFAMRGRQVSEWHADGNDHPIIARFSVEDRAGVDALLNLPVYSPSGEAIPLRALTETRRAPGLGQIRRHNRESGLSLNIELQEEVTSETAMNEVTQMMESIIFPPGTSWSKEGFRRDQQSDQAAQQKALMLSSVLVFLLMGVLFESFMLPFAIIMTLPMAGVGVIWTLYLTETSLDIMVGVGLVILVGVVVNNGIVLIDRVTQLREEGLSRHDALLQAGERRLRPILMTALTTITGLIPMALGTRSFVGIPYAPLGIAVVGGLATATLLTLFLLPWLYTLFDDLRAVNSRYWGYALGSRRASVKET